MLNYCASKTHRLQSKERTMFVQCSSVSKGKNLAPSSHRAYLLQAPIPGKSVSSSRLSAKLDVEHVPQSKNCSFILLKESKVLWTMTPAKFCWREPTSMMDALLDLWMTISGNDVIEKDSWLVVSFFFHLRSYYIMSTPKATGKGGKKRMFL